ncbi:MAG: sulfatase-like hydrolase/transferase [Planctomycetes bacterium]|nr:sulfatase-like hydrolase/transferase [Planctomycetota bacterium]
MSQPNFLVICMDQISAFSLACNGNKVVKTPNMDRLAAGGVNFTRAYCSNPVCMPNRASFITGLTPRQHGLLTNGSFLPEDVPTLGGALAAKGYRTHSVGKLHFQPYGPNQLGDGRSSLEQGSRWKSRELSALPSPYYGFQTSDWTGGHVNGINGHYMQWLEDHHPEVVDKWRRENAYHHSGNEIYRLEVPAELHYNHWIADRSIDFLQKEGANPFFLFCSFPDPHHPFAATRPYSEMYNPDEMELPATYQNDEDLIAFLKAYRPFFGNKAPEEAVMREIIAQTYGMITHVDDNIGRILVRLEALGLGENTHVILTADHGEYLGNHDLIHKAAYPYESLYRIPLIWKAPGGSVTDCPVPASTVDFVPTVCELAGVDTTYFTARGFGESEKLSLPGQSLLPALRGEPLSARPVLLEYDEDCHAGPLLRQRGLVEGPFKMVLYHGSEEGILVKVDSDPNELDNLWEHPEYQEVKDRMLLQLLRRLVATERFDNNRVCWA